MSVTKFLASDFNGEQVANYFNVAPSRTAVRAAMNLMYRINKEEAVLRAEDTRSRAKEIAGITCEELEFDYSLFNEFYEDFGKGRKFDHEALAIAAICRESVERINGARRTRNGEIRENNDGIDPELAQRAQRIREQACRLVHKTISPEECSEEAIFLGHMLPFKDFGNHEAAFEINPHADYKGVKILISTVRGYLRAKTDIGRTLIGIIDGIEQELSRQDRIRTLPPAPHEAFDFMQQSGVQKVFSHFDLGPAHHDERVAMAFVYDMILEEENKKLDKDARRFFASDKTIENTEFDFRVHRYYAEDFFEGEDIFDTRALVYALYCGRRLEQANDEIEQTQDEIRRNAPPRFHGEDFVELSLQNAIDMLEEAESMCAGVWLNPSKQPYTESFFIAHVNGIKALREFQKNMDEHSIEELDDFAKNFLKPYKNLAQPHKNIGAELLAQIDMTERKISELKAREPEPKALRRPVLQLVTPEFHGFK